LPSGLTPEHRARLRRSLLVMQPHGVFVSGCRVPVGQRHRSSTECDPVMRSHTSSHVLACHDSCSGSPNTATTTAVAEIPRITVTRIHHVSQSSFLRGCRGLERLRDSRLMAMVCSIAAPRCERAENRDRTFYRMPKSFPSALRGEPVPIAESVDVLVGAAQKSTRAMAVEWSRR
jgi:hypothetical protein